MSIMMTLQLDTEIEQPPWFSSWYSQLLPEYIGEFISGAGAVRNIIGRLVQHFDLSIDPLLKVAGQDFSREEFPSEEIFLQYQAAQEAAWQPPQDLIECIRTFIEKIEGDPEIFSRLQIEESYFSRGGFKKDLLDVIRMCEWARDNGVQKVRLEAA